MNLSISDISRRVNRSRKAIRRYLNDSESYGTKTSPGRPQKLSEHEKRVVLREVSKGFSSTRDLKNNLNLEVSRWTVFRCLQRSSFLKFVKRHHQPLLTEAHKKIRLNWAKEMVISEMNWDSVIFSDEKKLNLDGPDGYKYYWHDVRGPQKHFFIRNFGGASVMVWTAISSRGSSELVFLEGKQNSLKYVETLVRYLSLRCVTNLEMMHSFFSMTMPRYTHQDWQKLFSRRGIWRFWSSQLASQTWTPLKTCGDCLLGRYTPMGSNISVFMNWKMLWIRPGRNWMKSAWNLSWFH